MIIFSKKLVACLIQSSIEEFFSISTSNGLLREMATGCGVEPAAIRSDRGKQFLIRSVKPQTGASRSSGVEKGAHDGGGETRTHQFAQIFACFEIPRGGTF